MIYPSFSNCLYARRGKNTQTALKKKKALYFISGEDSEKDRWDGRFMKSNLLLYFNF